MKRKLFSLFVLLTLVTSLVGCGGTPTAVPTATPIPTSASTATSAPTATSSPTPPPTDTAEPTASPEPAPTEAPAAVEFEPFTEQAMGIQGLVPQGWQQASLGVYVRGLGPGDLVSLIQQAAPGATAEQLSGLLQTQLGINEMPEPTGNLETAAFAWDLYLIEVEAPGVGQVMVDLALAETEVGTYLVLLQALPDEYQALHDSVFLPAVEALVPLGETEEDSGNLYEQPDGLFSVPVPTNWTLETAEGYATLSSPDDEVIVYVLAVEADDLEAGIDQAWHLVDAEFALEPDEVIDEPNVTGAERTVTITYDDPDDEEALILAGGWLYEGMAYVELFVTDIEGYQKRTSQLQIINSGFKIAALEETDLSGVEPQPLSEDLLADLEAYLIEKMDELEVPGAAMAIVQDGEVVYAQGFGVRALDGGEPVTPQTLMMIGSTTKSMTTMLMAQLVDEGSFAWDTPVVEILPTFAVADPEVTEMITMRNMVCACSGVPRRDLEWLFNADTLTAESIVESLADFEFFTDFGEAFQYSNQMVAAGGYLATLAAGGTYGRLYDDYVALMQDRILDPLAMSASTFSFDEVVAGGNYALPYGLTPVGDLLELPLENEAVLVPIGPAGGLWSNVEDMARYLIAQLGRGVTADGQRIVSEENLLVTWQPQVDISAEASYGLGWIVEDYDGVQVISHGGNTFGFTSDLAFLPEQGLGISILTNQQYSSLNAAVRYRLLELLYQQEPQLEEVLQFQLEQVAEARAELRSALQDGIEAEAVEAYLGDYEHEVLGQVTLRWQDEALVLDVGEFQSEIRATVNEEGETNYLTFEPPLAGLPLEFSTNEAGDPVLVLGVGVVEYTFEKIDG